MQSEKFLYFYLIKNLSFFFLKIKLLYEVAEDYNQRQRKKE